MNLLFLGDIFKRFTSYADVIKDNDAIVINGIGGILIGITFMTIGLMCVLLTRPPIEENKKRGILSKLFGYFLISCSLSLIIDTFCIWYNYAILAGIVKLMTATIAIIAIAYTPSVIREIEKLNALRDVGESLDKTNDKMDRLNELGNKIVS